MNHLDEELEFTVYCYQNGREHGFEVKNYNNRSKGWEPATVTFAENRNSDALVIYPGNQEMSAIDDEAYANAKYFHFSEWEKAYQYCSQILLTKEEGNGTES